MVAAWAVDRLGRSLRDLINFLEEIRERDVDLYLHKQALDTSTTTGRAMFAMLSIFSEMERSILVERINAGLNRVRAEGVKRISRPPTPTEKKIDKAKKLLVAGTGIRATAKKVKVSAALVQRLKHEMVAAGELLPS
ncbi:MAG: recombinase family protein [Rhodospirillaceae bacterium]|nr:recombinase family protein [Rhodospirillales bacterium]